MVKSEFLSPSPKVVDASDRVVPYDGKTPWEVLILGPWITGRYHDTPGSEVRLIEGG